MSSNKDIKDYRDVANKYNSLGVTYLVELKYLDEEKDL